MNTICFEKLTHRAVLHPLLSASPSPPARRKVKSASMLSFGRKTSSTGTRREVNNPEGSTSHRAVIRWLEEIEFQRMDGRDREIEEGVQ